MKRISQLEEFGRIHREALKGNEVKRDWKAAREKVDAEGCCRVCGEMWRVEAAHITGREHDRDSRNGLVWGRDPNALFVRPDRIVPLCGPATDTTTCHGKQHAKRLDLLPYLTREEETQAVADVGIERAHRLLAPSIYRSERLR
jgi:hypothetical protein